jgi:hypothetical protein
MADVQYVVFSDLHLGAENSILTNLDKVHKVQTDVTKPSPVLVKMVECLKEVLSKNKSDKKPKLVLNGDIIELALATTNDGAMAFERFVELIMPKNGEFLFDDEVLFMAGNHDHNLWERARNQHFAKYLDNLNSGDFIEDEPHGTNLFNPEKITAPFLQSLLHMHEHLHCLKVTAVYPAHGLLSEDKNKCVIITHGHYVESIYSLMTTLRSTIFPDRALPQTLEELEEENYAWVDFFWSTLGRSGAVGKDLNLIYDKMQDPAQVKILIRNIATSLTMKKKNFIVRWFEERVLEEILNLTLGKMAANERNTPEVELGPDATEGLTKYMELFLLSHIKDELKGHVPEDMSFIFGHTHKPFQRLMNFKGYKKPVKVYNGGGWVVDTMNKQPLHGGSIVLIDEHLDVVALQMYREGKINVTVEDIYDSNETDCPFFEQITNDIDMSKEPWSGFAEIVDYEVKIRYENLGEIAKSNN